LEFCCNKGYISEANPVRLRKQWFEEPRRESHVRPEDLVKFYSAVQNLQNDVARDYLTLLLFAGLRRGEAASLMWDDIDFEHRMLRIPAKRTKSGRKHALPLSDVVFDMLSSRRHLPLIDTPKKEARQVQRRIFAVPELAAALVEKGYAQLSVVRRLGLILPTAAHSGRAKGSRNA
jgi:integrase